jgi:hypothetical protein
MMKLIFDMTSMSVSKYDQVLNYNQPFYATRASPRNSISIFMFRLNEGFATWVGNQAIDHLFPEWDVWTRFVSSYTFSALNLDGLKSSHPIEVEARH